MQFNARLMSYVVMAVVVAGVLFLRMRRLSKAQPLKLERLWIVPTVLVVGVAIALSQAPPRGSDWLWLGLALVIGGGFGWLRGSTMAIAVDEQTHALNVRASPAAMLFLVALVAVRYGLRSALTTNASTLHLSVALITDASLMFAVGLLGVQRVEMAIRARRLLAAAKASHPKA
jgi:hypothetical protein